MDESAANARRSSVSSSSKVLIAQAGIGIVLALSLWGFAGRVAATSALVGSLICVIPNAYLAFRLNVADRSGGPRALLRAAWAGEAGKLALTVLLFSAVFLLVRPLAAGALFAGFIAAELMTFTGFFMHDGKR